MEYEEEKRCGDSGETGQMMSKKRWRRGKGKEERKGKGKRGAPK